MEAALAEQTASLSTIIVDSNGDPIGQVIYRCALCRKICDSSSDAMIHYQVDHIELTRIQLHQQAQAAAAAAAAAANQSQHYHHQTNSSSSSNSNARASHQAALSASTSSNLSQSNRRIGSASQQSSSNSLLKRSSSSGNSTYSPHHQASKIDHRPYTTTSASRAKKYALSSSPSTQQSPTQQRQQQQQQAKIAKSSRSRTATQRFTQNSSRNNQYTADLQAKIHRIESSAAKQKAQRRQMKQDTSEDEEEEVGPFGLDEEEESEEDEQKAKVAKSSRSRTATQRFTQNSSRNNQYTTDLQAKLHRIESSAAKQKAQRRPMMDEGVGTFRLDEEEESEEDDEDYGPNSRNRRQLHQRQPQRNNRTNQSQNQHVEQDFSQLHDRTILQPEDRPNNNNQRSLNDAGGLNDREDEEEEQHEDKSMINVDEEEKKDQTNQKQIEQQATLAKHQQQQKLGQSASNSIIQKARSILARQQSITRQIQEENRMQNNKHFEKEVRIRTRTHNTRQIDINSTSSQRQSESSDASPVSSNLNTSGLEQVCTPDDISQIVDSKVDANNLPQNTSITPHATLDGDFQQDAPQQQQSNSTGLPQAPNTAASSKDPKSKSYSLRPRGTPKYDRHKESI